MLPSSSSSDALEIIEDDVMMINDTASVASSTPQDCRGAWIDEMVHQWSVYRKYASTCDLYEFCTSISESDVTPDFLKERILREKLSGKERVFIVSVLVGCSIGDAFIIKTVLSSGVFLCEEFADIGTEIRNKALAEPEESYNGIGYTRFVRGHKLTKPHYSASQIALATAGPDKAMATEQSMHGSISVIAALLLPLSWKGELHVVAAPTTTSLTQVAHAIGILNSSLFLYAIIISTGMVIFSSVFGLTEPGVAHYFSINIFIRYSPAIALMATLLLLFPLEISLDIGMGLLAEMWKCGRG